MQLRGKELDLQTIKGDQCHDGTHGIGLCRGGGGEPSSSLSTREAEVLQLLIEGQTNKQIALALHICVKTVEFHLKNIYVKLNVENRAQAIAKAVQIRKNED